MKKLKANDLVEFNLKGEVVQGRIKQIYINKKIARVRVFKNNIPAWHEWIRLKDLILIDRGESYE